jgi:hypothetical protein
MAPDRGSVASEALANSSLGIASEEQRRRSDARKYIAEHASEGQNFTLRGILVGLGVGLIICFSNMYFGLQESCPFPGSEKNI